MTGAFVILLIVFAYALLELSLALAGLGAPLRRLILLALAAAVSIAVLYRKKERTGIVRSVLKHWEIKKAPALDCAACALLGAGLSTLCSSIILMLPTSLSAEYTASAAPLTALTPVVIADTVIAAPLLEELVFRHAVLGRMRSALPTALALVCSAALFGAFHTGAIWMIYSALCALVLGALYLKYSSILPPLAMHAAFNGINYAAPLLPDSTPPYLTAALSAALVALAAAFLLTRAKSARSE